MNKTHRTTLTAIFVRPTRSDVRWADVEALVHALGGEIGEREGSRVSFTLNGVRAIFHRPHPQPSARKGLVDAVRRYLQQAGVEP